MIKHDKDVCKKKGQPESSYRPRAPLSERLAAAAAAKRAEEEEKRRRQDQEADASGGGRPAIQAREGDGEDDVDREILAAVARADCVSGEGAC